MTATIVVLVFITSVYTYQVLEQQKGAAEFQVVEKSILAFDDALENIAWKPQGARSTRFDINYGQLDLIQDIPLLIQVTGYDNASRSLTTGIMRYRTQTSYMNFGENYSNYILGDGQMISSGSGSCGSVHVEQSSGWVSVTLAYGVRAMETSTFNITQDDQLVTVSYVDIWIIQLDTSGGPTDIGSFDLRARTLDVVTLSSSVYSVDQDNRQFSISVRLGDNDPAQASIQLDESADRVVFNYIISTIRVSI